MQTLNGAKFEKLKGITGHKGTLNSQEIAWLNGRGRDAETLNGKWQQEFVAVAGGAPIPAKPQLPFNQNAYAYLTFLGISGTTLNEKWYDLWVNGVLPV